jgi:hypothetical protein
MYSHGYGSVYLGRVSEAVEARNRLACNLPSLADEAVAVDNIVFDLTEEIISPTLKEANKIELDSMIGMLSEEDKENIVKAYLGNIVTERVEEAVDGYQSVSFPKQKTRLEVKRGGVHSSHTLTPYDKQPQSLNGKKYLSPGDSFSGVAVDFALLPELGGYLCLRRGLRFMHILGLVDPSTAEPRVNLAIKDNR